VVFCAYWIINHNRLHFFTFVLNPDCITLYGAGKPWNVLDAPSLRSPSISKRGMAFGNPPNLSAGEAQAEAMQSGLPMPS